MAVRSCQHRMLYYLFSGGLGLVVIFLMSKRALPSWWPVPCLAAPGPLAQLPSDADRRQGGGEKVVGRVQAFTTTKTTQ